MEQDNQESNVLMLTHALTIVDEALRFARVDPMTLAGLDARGGISAFKCFRDSVDMMHSTGVAVLLDREDAQRPLKTYWNIHSKWLVALIAVFMLGGVVPASSAQGTAPAPGGAQGGGGSPPADDPNAANNPLTPKVTFQFNDYYEPSYIGPGDEGNLFQLRGIIPQKLFGQSELLRATIPVVTSPAVEGAPAMEGLGDSQTGLGDIELDEIIKFKAGKAQLGLGPLLIAPTASDQRLGAGKWQSGVAGLAIVPQKWGLAGLIVTYSTSFAGERVRPSQENLVVQPVLIYNFPEGYYARSSGVWQFGLHRDQPEFIPIGAGFGRIIKMSPKSVLNLSLEPQYTVWNQGISTDIPRWQILFAMTLQFDEK